MRKICPFGFFVFFIFCVKLFAQSPEEIYTRANLSYENEDYQKAISLYEKLVEMDRVSPGVFYNLGNSYFKSGRIGKAILNYERSLRMAPRDREARLNLKLARGMAIDKIETPERGFILSAVLFLYEAMNINELSALVSIVYLAIMLLLAFSIFITTKRKVLFYNAGALGILLALLMIFLVSKIHNENFVKYAVVVSKKVDIRSGPKEDYLLQFTLHEGTKFRVVKERQDWYEIDLSKDLRGWLPKDSVEVI